MNTTQSQSNRMQTTRHNTTRRKNRTTAILIFMDVFFPAQKTHHPSIVSLFLYVFLNTLMHLSSSHHQSNSIRPMNHQPVSFVTKRTDQKVQREWERIINIDIVSLFSFEQVQSFQLSSWIFNILPMVKKEKCIVLYDWMSRTVPHCFTSSSSSFPYQCVFCCFDRRSSIRSDQPNRSMNEWIIVGSERWNHDYWADAYW